MWFNERYVTADVPPEKDLETWLEVGSWTWNWMEPPLGTISFVLLCVQVHKASSSSACRQLATNTLDRFVCVSPCSCVCVSA